MKVEGFTRGGRTHDHGYPVAFPEGAVVVVDSIGPREFCALCDTRPLPVARVRAPWWRRLLAWRPWRSALEPASMSAINEGGGLTVRLIDLGIYVENSTPYVHRLDDGRPPPTAMPGPGVPSPR